MPNRSWMQQNLYHSFLFYETRKCSVSTAPNQIFEIQTIQRCKIDVAWPLLARILCERASHARPADVKSE
jgi:hypothetical protein